MRTQFGIYFLVLLIAASVAITYAIFQPFIGPLILAAVFAVVLQPLYLRLQRSMLRWPSLAALATVIISIVCILVPLSIVGTRIGIESHQLYRQLSNVETRAQITRTIHAFEDVIVTRFPRAEGFSENLSANLSQYMRTALQWGIEHVGVAFSGAASLVLKFFLFFIALYYLLRDGKSLKEKIIELSPLRDGYDELIFDKLELAVNSVIKGNLTIALLQGCLTAIGFTIFGVSNAVLWGTVAAIAALIPGLGTGLVFVPTILYMYFSGAEGSALGLIIWGIIAVGMIDNFLGPQLIGGGVKLHPLMVLLSVLGGLSLFGPLGIFLGPIAISMLFAVLSIYSAVLYADKAR